MNSFYYPFFEIIQGWWCIVMIIGIVGAMECEIMLIKEEMKISHFDTRAQMNFFSGTYKGNKVIVVKSGIGKVNAAVCTQILIDIYCVDLIVNIGVAGGVKRDLNLGDVVIATDLIQHDVDGSACSYDIGQVPKLDTYSFKCDSHLIDKALLNAEAINEFNIVKGRIITGDQIISSTIKLDFFREKFDPYAVEMESAAIGHTCYLNKKEFIVIRAISDRADEDLAAIYDDYEEKAVKNATLVLGNLLSNLQVNDNED